MRDTYREKVVENMRKDGRNEDYIEDWCRVYDETGLDMRNLCDGMDVDTFLEAYEQGDLDSMILLS